VFKLLYPLPPPKTNVNPITSFSAVWRVKYGANRCPVVLEQNIISPVYLGIPNLGRLKILGEKYILSIYRIFLLFPIIY
jgi:hypothetical protein